MNTRQSQPTRRALWVLLLVLFLFSSFALAAKTSATLLLEEPYGKLGFFSPTGHAAVYLSGVCADTPVHLRPCAAGETGVVLSRYDGVNGYDWLAIPLIPYLYAVERPEEVPLFADAAMTSVLRDRYRRKHLEGVIHDLKDGATPAGNWYELVGSSYDRTIYGFEIETNSAQDAALIKKLNAGSNVSHFHTVSRNCADFAKDILNFYYSGALHRSVVADVGITTPKQMAKTLTRYSSHHPQIPFSRIVIAQVPGSMPRSTAVHGVVESFFKSKKYIVPSAVVSPIFAGCVAAVYVGTVAGRFEPAHDADVFVVGGDPERPLDHEDLRAYREQLKHLIAGMYPDKKSWSIQSRNIDRDWAKLQKSARTDFDAQGRPMLVFQMGDKQVNMGLSAENILESTAPPELIQQLLEARLQSELQHRPATGITEAEVSRDWNLLEKTMAGGEMGVTPTQTRFQSLRGTRP